MRSFIAIPIPEHCLEMLRQMQRQLQASRAEVRWTATQSIHLTLKFLGEIDPQIVPGLGQSLRDALQSSRAFGIRLAGTGCFPNQRNPRVIWCGIGGDTTALAGLQTTVETVCKDFGYPPENRPFHPHLTLGRVKGSKNIRPLIENVMKESGMACEFTADRLNVYKSVLQPQGAVYTILDTVELN
jgi:2'-5' RNA ligase